MSSRFVIFSGYNDRAVVALCRELTALGEPFSIIAAHGRDRIFRTAYRPHVDAIRTVRSLDADDLDRCLARVRARHQAARYVIAPSSEFLDQYVLDHRAWFQARGADVPLVDRDIYARVTNKWSFRALCEGAGVGVPPLVDPAAGRYPFVAKPRTNITADGQSLYPVLIYTDDDWRAAQAMAVSEAHYYFEALIDGPSYYLLFYVPANPAAPVFRWSQRNRAQQPGGKSMLWATSDTLHDAPIADQLVGALRATGFHGLAMIELIRDADTFRAIELNPRLWGPLQLVRNAGSHLLRAFVEEALHGDIHASDPHAGHAASYVWLGGARAGLVWHEPPPRFPWLALAAQAAGDIYLRPDTWPVFFDEWAGSLE